jgi:hypothetical protein
VSSALKLNLQPFSLDDNIKAKLYNTILAFDDHLVAYETGVDWWSSAAGLGVKTTKYTLMGTYASPQLSPNFMSEIPSSNWGLK